MVLLLAQGCAATEQATSDAGAESLEAEARFVLARNALGAGRSADAAAHYRKAAEQGHAPSQFSLGVLHALGAGVPRDIDQALIWYGKAAETSGADAQYTLAERLAQGMPGRGAL